MRSMKKCGVRILASIGMIILVQTIWLLPSVSLCQTWQQRSPNVTGCVVDNYPYSHSADADSVESGMLIGRINNVERSAVMEFDISDLVPGQVDAARITGQITANNSAPAGTRTHNFVVSAGDGVLSISDNLITSGSYQCGSVSHDAGGSSDYNFNITSKYRSLIRQNSTSLREFIYPSDTQGWDAVSSLYPAPKLELSVRPVSSTTTVYYRTPVATAAATAQGDGPFTIDTTATRAGVMNWTYSPYEKGRGLMEYDLSDIPVGAHVTWAKLDVYLPGLQGQVGKSGPNLNLVGYLGDGSITSSDLQIPDVIVGTSGEITGTGFSSWSLDPTFIENAIASGSYLGIRAQPGTNAQFQTKLQLTDLLGAGYAPYLAIAYEVPEPGSIVLLLITVGSFLGYGLKRRGRK
jgi:hypothetical protein